MGESLKQKTFKGTIWSAIEQFSVQGVQFIVMLFMARLLTPSDFGIIGMIGIFIAISNAFIDGGFLPALIRKNDRTDIDTSTVFYFNIVVGFFLYGILFFCAPLIAQFYNVPTLTPITRVVGLSLVIGSLNLVQKAQFTINLNFKIQAKISLIASISSGFVGIFCAYNGFGVWALVIQQLINLIISTILIWIWAVWKPIIAFSWNSFKELFGFGSKLLISNLIDATFTNIYSLIIGKVYKAEDLGFYTRAQGFSQIVAVNSTGILRRVTFPVLCTIQNDDDRLRINYTRILKLSTFIIFPLLIGMASVAKPMILTLIGEKWIFSAKLLLPICLAGMWYPVHAINLNLLQVKGRSDLFLRLEIIKKVSIICVLIITVPLGLYWMCWGSVFSSLICLGINTYYTGKLIDLGFWTQMKNLLPNLLLSLGMGALVWITVIILPLSPIAQLTISVVEGIFIYIVGAKLFHFSEITEISSLIKKKK